MAQFSSDQNISSLVKRANVLAKNFSLNQIDRIVEEADLEHDLYQDLGECRWL